MKVYIISDKYGVSGVFGTIKKAEEWLLVRGIIKKQNEKGTYYDYADEKKEQWVSYIQEWVVK